MQNLMKASFYCNKLSSFQPGLISQSLYKKRNQNLDILSELLKNYDIELKLMMNNVLIKEGVIYICQ